MFFVIRAILATFALSKTNLSPETIHCVFKNSLEVGASVTGRVGETVPFYSTIQWALFGIKGADYRGSPSGFFIDHYRKLDPDFYRMDRGRRKYETKNLAFSLTNTLEKTGMGQIKSLLEGNRRREYAASSIIIGVDLFYWDAIWGNCSRFPIGDKSMLQDVGIPGVEYQIARLIKTAQEDRKTLVLGALPYEDRSKVLIDSRRLGISGWWYPQSFECVRSINETLKHFCKKERNCYIAPIGEMAESLARGNKIYVDSLRKEIDLYEARPDGVHLSFAGSKGVAGQMIQLFEQSPPFCSNQSEKIEETKHHSQGSAR